MLLPLDAAESVGGPCDLRKVLPKGATGSLCGYVTSQILF